jgi:hypothetical protein
MRHTTKLIACCLVLVVPTGCKTTLEDGGAYAGHKVLYDCDVTISAAWALTDAVVRWEKDNRQLLSEFPEIKIAVDDVRRKAPTAFRQAIAARDAYAAARTAETSGTLDQALTMIRALAAEASAILGGYDL